MMKCTRDWLSGLERMHFQRRSSLRSEHAPMNHPLYWNGDSIGCIELNVINVGAKYEVFGISLVVEA